MSLNKSREKTVAVVLCSVYNATWGGSHNLFQNDIISPPNCLCNLNSWLHCTVFMALDLSLLKVLILAVNSNSELSKKRPRKSGKGRTCS